MVYYRVKPKYDGLNIHPCFKGNNFLIANELYTEKEYQKLLEQGLKHYIHNVSFFDYIRTPKSNIYWLFGARFVIDNTKIY